MKCANGTTYWRCDYCWYKQQLATLQAQLRQVEGGRAKWEDIAGLRFAGDHKFVKEMELLKIEHAKLRQLVEALPSFHVVCSQRKWYLRISGQFCLTSEDEAMVWNRLLQYRATLAAPPHG